MHRSRKPNNRRKYLDDKDFCAKSDDGPAAPKLGSIGLLGRLYRRCSSLNLFRRLCGLVGANRICAFSMRAS
jgi:hypothetical protein